MAYWCCAQLDQRRERLALYCLDLAGYRTYVPRIRGPRRTSLPLFPSYAFILVELQWWQARWAVGVRSLIQNGSAEPAHVPDRIIEELRAREGRDGLVTLPPPPRSGPQFQPGDRVRVKSGPLVGLPGLVSTMRPHQRVEMLLQMLGGQQRVDLAAADVERLA
jgi:transcriptional antiterminator RfaH